MLWVERGEKYCSTELRAAICRLGRITNFPPDFMLVQASHPDFSLAGRLRLSIVPYGSGPYVFEEINRHS